MAKHAEQRKVEVDPGDITFGVEIECLIPSRFVRERGITVGRYHHGDRLPAPFPTGWTAQRDGSLLSESRFTPMEIVSPVLRSLAGLEEILKVFRILNDAGAKVNDSCGFHVHVGARSVLGDRADDRALNVRWVRRMLHLMSRHEGALFAITGRPSRWHNDFCRTIKYKWDGVLETTSDLAEIERHIAGHGERYYTLNLKNLFGMRRTVEFRLFGATTDGLQAIGYVITALGIAHRAAECGTVAPFEGRRDALTPQTWADAVRSLHHTLSGYGWIPDAKRQWGKGIRRVQRENARSFIQARGRRVL
jgi:hypothetical protein